MTGNLRAQPDPTSRIVSFVFAPENSGPIDFLKRDLLLACQLPSIDLGWHFLMICQRVPNRPGRSVTHAHTQIVPSAWLGKIPIASTAGLVPIFCVLIRNSFRRLDVARSFCPSFFRSSNQAVINRQAWWMCDSVREPRRACTNPWESATRNGTDSSRHSPVSRGSILFLGKSENPKFYQMNF